MSSYSSEECEPLLKSSANGGGEDWREQKECKPKTLIKLPVGTSANSKASSYRFGWQFFKRFWLILRVAVPRVLSWSMLLLIMLVLARSAEEYTYYEVGILPSQFYSALTGKNSAQFKDILWKMTILVVSLCICKSGGEFAAGLVHVRWREEITMFLHKNYFNHRVYYRLNVTDRRVDNPDQRITQDVDRFCEEVSQALPKLILQPFLIAYYSYHTFISLGWFGVLGIYVLFIISTILNKFIMGPIVNYVYLKERREGDFRFHHVQVRSNAEAVALYKGGNLEGRKLNHRLNFLLDAQRGTVHWNLPLNFSVFMMDYVSSIISYSLVGVAIFSSGRYDGYTSVQLASVVSKNAFFSMYLLNSFSTIVDTAVKFAEIAGYTHRIGQLLEVLKDMEKERKLEEEERGRESSCKAREQELYSATSPPNQDSSSTYSSDLGPSAPSINTTTVSLDEDNSEVPSPQCVEVAAILKDAAIAPPGELTPLIEGLNLEVRKGTNVLIMGETGCGKSSIFRVLFGLWEPLHGCARLCVPHSHHYVMVLPQKPHLTSGTLADQVCYPEKPKKDDDSQGMSGSSVKISECLATSGLMSVCDRLGGIHATVSGNWYDVLSPGEIQRLSFCRIFYHLPPFAFLDEATSALSEPAEEMLYSKLTDLGITYLSIGQRSSLKKFHHEVLTIGSA